MLQMFPNVRLVNSEFPGPQRPWTPQAVRNGASVSITSTWRAHCSSALASCSATDRKVSNRTGGKENGVGPVAGLKADWKELQTIGCAIAAGLPSTTSVGFDQTTKTKGEGDEDDQKGEEE